MRAFFITNHILEGNGGGIYATKAYLEAFSSIFDEVVLLHPQGKSPLKDIPNNVKLFEFNAPQSNLKKLVNIYAGKINRFTGKVIPLIDKYPPDVVIFDNSKSTVGSINEISKRKIPIITIHHNYEREYLDANKPPIYYRHIYKYFVKKTEKNSLLKSSLNFVLTEHDEKKLRQVYKLDSSTKFDQISVFLRPSIDTLKHNLMHNKSSKIIFAITGSLNTTQNINPIVDFISYYMPIIESLTTNYEIIIAGKNPVDKITKACDSNAKIKLIKNPSNILDVIAQADIYICPIDNGGGLKLRIMDGLSLGLPILTHFQSLRGYEDFAKEGIISTYTNTNDFQTSLNSLINNISIVKQTKYKEKNAFYFNKIMSFEAGTKKLKKKLKSHGFLG